MNISIPASAKAAEIVHLIRSAQDGDCLLCHQERQYALVKIALVKLQRSDLGVELYSKDGRLIRQLTAKRKNETAAIMPEPIGLTADQIRAVKQLEIAFQECFTQKLHVIGFSDGLVAVPVDAGISMDVLSSSEALDVDTMDVYKGYEADIDD